MPANTKRVDQLSDEDLDRSPIWTFVPDRTGALLVRPVKGPVRNFSGKLIGTFVTLANGDRVRALLGNLDPTNARLTQHFLTLSIARGGVWFHLARYHDHDFRKRGPRALATFLGLGVKDVFPISYDVRTHARGPRRVAAGTIAAKPPEKLRRSELIELAVP